MKTVMIISDATGETAERMVRAATLQFSEPVQIRLFSRVRLESELEQILEKAAELKALVVFTVVNQEERDLIAKLVEKHSIEDDARLPMQHVRRFESRFEPKPPQVGGDPRQALLGYVDGRDSRPGARSGPTATNSPSRRWSPLRQ